MALHFLDVYRESDSMDGFVARGRHDDYMRRMAMQVITRDNRSLRGAAVAAQSPDRCKPERLRFP